MKKEKTLVHTKDEDRRVRSVRRLALATSDDLDPPSALTLLDSR